MRIIRPPRFFVLLVADLSDPTPFLGGGFEPVMLGEIGIADIRAEAMKYDILELNTNVKPQFLMHLIEKHSLDTLTYLDPDIFVYAPLAPVFDALDAGASCVLTPHITTPVWDGKSPSEQDLLSNGTYNLGFIAVSASDESKRLLEWWNVRCLEAGFSEGRTGLFVDQKWINLVPGLFGNAFITRDAGLNMAYWNLHERSLTHSGENYTVLNPTNGETPLRFYHFSGVVVDDETVLSKHTDRFTLAERPDIQQLFADYKAAVAATALRLLKQASCPTATTPSPTAPPSRASHVVIFAAHQQHFAGDPFDANGTFASFAKQNKLVAGVVAPAKSTWKDFNPVDRRVNAVHKLLKLALKVLGPHKYELLMRYLAYIAVLRNQSVFLRDAKWPIDKAGK